MTLMYRKEKSTNSMSISAVHRIKKHERYYHMKNYGEDERVLAFRNES